jgi:periplasmic mercuric ion binding protein
MKSIRILIAMIIAISSVQFANAQDSKADLRNFEPKPKFITFKVYGECGMCKKRIEKALKVDGIRSALWNVDTKMLTVQYVLTAEITGENEIQQLVAAAGHDTDKYHAPDSVYNNLPGCCHYERAKGK